MMPFDEKLADQDHAVSEPIDPEDLYQICQRLDAIEKNIAEFKELAGKIWTFVEQMKTNPMFAAMLGGLPR